VEIRLELPVVMVTIPYLAPLRVLAAVAVAVE
jgi:hypothetical protein